jgi:hypothetical protein
MGMQARATAGQNRRLATCTTPDPLAVQNARRAPGYGLELAGKEEI